MNAARRTAIDKILEDLVALKDAIDKLPTFEDIEGEIATLAEEELIAFLDTPEDLQNSEEHEATQQAARNLKEAKGCAGELDLSDFLLSLGELIEKLEAAKGG